jgi:IclR family acetate operon transcriptional repressor
MALPKKINNNTPQTVEKALDVFEAFVESDSPLGVTEVSARLKMNKSTVYRLLRVLVKRGYVSQDEVTNKYFPAFKLVGMGGRILSRVPVRELARSTMEQLAQTTRHTLRLAVLENGEVVYIDQVEGKHPIRLHLRIGSRGPVYCTAAGKSIVAYLEEERQEKILSNCSFARLTAKTITSKKEYVAHLEQVRKHGYSVCDQEYEEQVRAVGAPIFNMEKRVTGAVVIVGPSFRLPIKELPRLGQAVRQAADDISSRMGYSRTGKEG